jgi:hypothetical protein
MKRYRASVLSFEGSVVSVIQLDCADDAEAMMRAKGLVEARLRQRTARDHQEATQLKGRRPRF